MRFSHLDLLEFKDDEAVAAYLALKFLKGGGLPLAGLISSIGASNPPLFIYLLAPLFCVSGNLVFVSACIAAQGSARWR